MSALQNKEYTNTSYSDEDLFVLMSYKKDNEKEAQEAFCIFYERYKKLLWSLCYNVCNNLDIKNGKEFAKYIFSDTMIAIYEHPTYDSRKSKLSTWMSKIAYNKALDLIKQNQHKIKVIPLDGSITSFIFDKETDIVEYDTPQKKILNEALNLLSERSREILLTCIMHKEGNKNLSDEVLSELSCRYSTTPDGIRQIKKRALDKMKKYILENFSCLNN